MRKIKFRMWDKINKQMLQHKQISVLLKNIGNNNQFEYMQFTGFRDKTGKEIYEHDIFKAAGGRTGTVAMVNGMWVIGNKDGVVELHWDADGGEVIGNIHADPELLEK